MNKTVNINLAGIFFHIDEDAFAKLQHYLDAIKRSFTNSQGRDEIVSDIEARVAELFNEKIKNDRHVIGLSEVEEIIAIMGQPEDYRLDDEIFEDEPVYRTTKSPRRLFRDTEHSYIGGVSSGLGHYFKIDPIWIRLLWVLFTIFSTGAFIVVYIVLWIFTPEAKTTADKLAMRGEEVTISNIEKKIREGFDDVADKVKRANYKKYGHKAQSGANSAANAISDVVSFILKIFVKLVGILLLLFAGSTLIGLFIGLFTVGTFGLVEAPWSDYIEMVVSDAPLWLMSLLSFFAIGIPFFFLFILGLKILVPNLKSIGRLPILVLAGLWFLSVIGLSIIGIQQATSRAFNGEVVSTELLPISPSDTLYVSMKTNPFFTTNIHRDGGFEIKQSENGNNVLFTNDVRLIVKSTKDTVGKIEVLKMAQGKDPNEARSRAENIRYSTSFADNKLLLGSFFTADMEYQYRDQEVQVTLYLPEGSILYVDENTYSFHRNSDYYDDILMNGDEEKFLTIIEDGTSCIDCPIDEDGNNEWDEDFDFRADENGVHLNIKSTDSTKYGKDVHSIIIDSNGIEIRNEE